MMLAKSRETVRNMSNSTANESNSRKRTISKKSRLLLCSNNHRRGSGSGHSV